MIFLYVYILYDVYDHTFTLLGISIRGLVTLGPPSPLACPKRPQHNERVSKLRLRFRAPTCLGASGLRDLGALDTLRAQKSNAPTHPAKRPEAGALGWMFGNFQTYRVVHDSSKNPPHSQQGSKNPTHPLESSHEFGATEFSSSSQMLVCSCSCPQP